MGADELPVAIVILSSGEIADVPEVFEVFVDKMEEQGTDVKALDSWDERTAAWLPAIWSAEAEFFRVFSLSLGYSSPLSESAAALVVEHENDKEWLKVLQAKETSDLAFSKRSVSLDANKLWRLPLRIFWNIKDPKNYIVLIDEHKNIEYNVAMTIYHYKMHLIC